MGWGALTGLSNLAYVPAKLVYAGIGGLTGGLALGLTGGDMNDRAGDLGAVAGRGLLPHPGDDPGRGGDLLRRGAVPQAAAPAPAAPASGPRSRRPTRDAPHYGG